MQSPEFLLQNLNRTLRELRGAAQVLNDERIDVELLPVMRRLLLAQVLGDTSIVAVGGSQGAGKTTLVATMYGLECDEKGWLRPNQGRGEHLPVLILEDRDAAVAQGFVRELRRHENEKDRFELVETKVDPDEFCEACRGARREALLPVLKVPQKFFAHSNHALMLLPGYERQNRDNRSWQELMRQGLIGATGCVIVTDMTRAANQQQQDILGDARQFDLGTLDPVIVVTKTEGLAQHLEEQKTTRQNAARVFKLDEGSAESHVICAGVSDPAYVEQWLPQLNRAIHRVCANAPRNRNAQLAHLEETLNRELGRALSGVQSRSIAFLSRHGDAEGSSQVVVKQCLDTFDEACGSLRETYRERIGAALAKRHSNAVEDLRDKLIENHEGFRNKIKSGLDTESESQRKIQRDISESWTARGSVLSVFSEVAGVLMEEKLGAPKLPVAARLADGQNPLQRLGYADQQNAPTVWQKPDADAINNLRVLFCAENDAEAQALRANKTLQATIRLLPALGLEYARAASVMPEMVGVTASGDGVLPQMDLVQSMETVHKQFSQFQTQTSNILKGLAFVMAVDFFADGKIDSIPAIINTLGMAGTAGAGAAGGAATATTAAGGVVSAIGATVASVVTVGFLVHTAIREVRQHDRQVSAFAFDALQGIKDRHQLHFLTQFDQLMGHLRERLRDGLHRRFHLDQTLMEQDRLCKALADARLFRRDLLDEIARSGQSIDMLASAAVE